VQNACEATLTWQSIFEQETKCPVRTPPLAERIAQHDLEADHKAFVTDALFDVVDGCRGPDVFNQPLAEGTLRRNLAG
jgi:hypothetical protein